MAGATLLLASSILIGHGGNADIAGLALAATGGVLLAAAMATRARSRPGNKLPVLLLASAAAAAAAAAATILVSPYINAPDTLQLALLAAAWTLGAAGLLSLGYTLHRSGAETPGTIYIIAAALLLAAPALHTLIPAMALLAAATAAEAARNNENTEQNNQQTNPSTLEQNNPTL